MTPDLWDEPARLDTYLPLPEGDDQFNAVFAENHRALVLRVEAQQAWVGVDTQPSEAFRRRAQTFLKRPVAWVRLAPGELTEQLSRRAGAAAGWGSEPEGGDSENALDRLANDAPIVNLVNALLLEGLRLGCSDIHLEAQAQEVRVRYRVDGVLRPGRSFPKPLFTGVSSRLKVMAHLNLLERRLPQDGKMVARVDEKDVEFRVSIVPTVEGESVVLRVFNRRDQRWTLSELGLGPALLRQLEKVVQSPHGLFLVTGPTGSGKTTTLSALLQSMNSAEVKILTVEDPVENNIPGLNQIQVHEEIGLSFESILRRLLRQDPDVLMIGEIRDRLTSDLAIRAALTGHLVLATLHTNDALGAVPRLVDMGVEPFLLGGVLRGVMAQRLVRCLCPACRRETEPDPAALSWLAHQGHSLDRHFEPVGCDLCGGRGYQGRTLVAELFLFDRSLEDRLSQGVRGPELVRLFKERQAPFLLDNGLDLVRRGQTSLAELQRVVAEL